MKVLCGDIGGTHANLCLATKKETIEIEQVQHLPTQQYSNFNDLVNQYLTSTGEKPESGCFAAAGVVKNNRIKMTNASLIIDALELKEHTTLNDVKIINDFDAVGFATNVLTSSDVVTLNSGKSHQKAIKCALGAGTGLGKSILVYHEKQQAYFPLSSEGGHSDFPIASEKEVKFIEGLKQPTWEDLLSGKGLEHIYTCLQKESYPKEPSKLSAFEISKDRHKRTICQEAFKWFVIFYARCAKNFAIEVLAKGGVFLAGGIGASNSDMFSEIFMEEFTKHHLPQFKSFLQDIPVKLITNYNISLKGSAFAQFI